MHIGNTSCPLIKTLIILCGIGHIGLGLGSLVIPRMLNWKSALSQTPNLIRQIFWTYAGYILSINIFFGIVSILHTDELLSGSGLSTALLILITLYWFSRIVIQFVYFDKTGVPEKFIYKAGEILLVMLFVGFTLVYGYAAFTRLIWVSFYRKIQLQLSYWSESCSQNFSWVLCSSEKEELVCGFGYFQ